MKVKQAKLASAVRGETSNLIDSAKYDLDFDKGMLHAKLKHNPKNYGDFIIFPANIAYLECEQSTEAALPVIENKLPQEKKPSTKK